ncbi:MAG: helix-turn-helix domain-containing protein [archaeon]
MKKPLFPCELVVWRILPAIRARLAQELAKKGMSQKDIAAQLGITPAAVSQYISKKRGEDFLIDNKLNNEIQTIVQGISNDNSTMRFMLESCSLCKKIRTRGLACKEHEKYAEVPSGCEMCFTGEGCSEC